MTDALIPDTALVPADEFRNRLPEGWLVCGYQATIYPDWSGREDRILQVGLWHQRGARVDLTMRRAPDWEWLTRYLTLVAAMPPDIRADAELRR